MIPAAFPYPGQAKPPTRGVPTPSTACPAANVPAAEHKGDSYPVVVPRAIGRDAHIGIAIGGARSVAMSRRMSPNRRREIATSAIWNAT